VAVSPAVGGGRVYFVDGTTGDHGRKLRCLDSATGELFWEVPVAADASGRFTLHPDGIVISDRAESLSLVDLWGERVWTRDGLRVLGEPCRADALLVASLKTPPGLVALDRPTGRELWRVAMEAAPTTSPVVRDRTIYVGTESGLQARRLLDGSPVWTAGEAAVVSGPVLDRTRVGCVTENSEVLIVSRTDGEVEERLPGALPDIPPLILRGAVVYADPEGLHLYRPDGGAAEWMDTSWLGRVSAPMIAVGRRIYFAAGERGFVCAGEWE
jgi:outer membrane protein assembly factor BamB